MEKAPTVYLEELFSDVITLAYNYAFGLCRLLIRPLNASLRLRARRRLSEKRQLSAHATLFVTVVLLNMSFTMFTWQMGPALGHYAATGHTPHSTQQILAAAIVAVVLIDLGFKVAARLLFKHDRRRQRRFVELGLYCSCSTIVYFGIVAVPAYQYLRGMVITLTMAE